MPDYEVGALLASDSFNRADGAIGSTDGGILGPLADLTASSASTTVRMAILNQRAALDALLAQLDA